MFYASTNASISATKVILVRHARTTYNEQGRYQGSSDESVLTPKGHHDAYATGLALRQYNFDAVYTSPLKRVQQTTQEIVAALNLSNIPVSVEPRLTEVCMADWQGLSYQEVKEKYPGADACWQNTPHLFTRNQINYPVIELFQQAQAFWQEILDKHRGQTILIVAHGGTNRALIGTAIALAPKHYHSLQQCNCGISCLEFSPYSNLGKVKYLNVTNHLGKNLPKLKAGKTGWRWLLLSDEVINKQFNLSDFSQLIQAGHIDLILAGEQQDSETFVASLVTDNCLSLHMPIDENGFFRSWQKTISHKQQIDNGLPLSPLFTGLIMVSNRLQAKLIGQIFDIGSAWELSNSLAVIHYPHGARRSILQGIIPLTLDWNQDVLAKCWGSEVMR